MHTASKGGIEDHAHSRNGKRLVRFVRLSCALLSISTVSTVLTALPSTAGKDPEDDRGTNRASAQTSMAVSNAQTPAARKSVCGPVWLFGKPTWEDNIRECDRPWKVCRRIRQGVKYVADTADQWSCPQDTWHSECGDCEDLAWCIEELCHSRGLDAHVVIYLADDSGGTLGHAVVVGREDGQLWVSSNGDYVECRTEEEIDRRMADFMGVRANLLTKIRLLHDELGIPYGLSLGMRSPAEQARP